MSSFLRSVTVHARPSAVRSGASGVKRVRRALQLLIVSSLVLAGCAGEATSTSTRTPHPPLVIETRLTAAERRAIFESVWRTINDEYFDPTFGGLDWQAVGEEYRQRLATVQDDDTFWRQVLNPMLWELGCPTSWPCRPSSPP